MEESYKGKMSIAPGKRIEEIDILKALAIICMVAGHSNAPFSKYIYLFHMAVFFMASGYFFKDSSSDSLKGVCKSVLRKIKLLWLPAFAWNTLYVLLHNVFFKINVYTNNPDILEYIPDTFVGAIAPYSSAEIVKHVLRGAVFSSYEPLFGILWFLKVLFIVSVCYVVGDYLAKRIFKKHILLIQLIVSVLLLSFGYICSCKGYVIHGLAHAASVYCLYYLGHILAVCKDKYITWNWKQYLPLLVGSFAILLILNNCGEIELSVNSYGNPLFLLSASFTGWVFLYSTSYFMMQIACLKNVMIAIGKRTMTVVVLHFLSMKIVEILVVRVYDLPNYCLAVFPNLYGQKGLWWLAYTIVGVGVPVILNMCYHLTADRLHNSMSKKQDN